MKTAFLFLATACIMSGSLALGLLAAVALSVMAPAKRIRELSITDTISAE